MEKAKIDRINELARASKVRELTEEEKTEQKILRDEYRASFRLSLTSQLDNTVIVDPEGNRRSLRKN
ncbi:MAG: DUF896 domain-containing protein [Clostridiales bacterium]|nr:DUF896 domain-containing protein [Clostridiales bacterium]